MFQSRRPTASAVKAGIEGSLLTTTYNIRSYDEATYMNEVNRIAQRNLDARPKTGVATYNYGTESKDISSVSRVKDAPATNYPINGTNAFTKFFAAHLIAGTEYIDISDYIGTDRNDVPGPYDALEEAITQNAYALGVEDYTLYVKQGIMQVTYNINKDDRAKAQKGISDEVAKLKDTIVKSGMSDKEKARAINNYLVDNATYDDDAFNRRSILFDDKPLAHYASSILVNKTGVCDGYASAFKVLADAVGLDSVVVTGRIKGSVIGHAWNKVYMDNKWQIVDVTFNDSDTEKNKYFGLTDANADRIQYTGFVADPLIRNYAAN